jgi:hypothetical protein
LRAEREIEWAREDALRAWMLLCCRPLIGYCAWMKRGELKLVLTMIMMRVSHLQCPIPLHFRLLLMEDYMLTYDIATVFPSGHTYPQR